MPGLDRSSAKGKDMEMKGAVVPRADPPCPPDLPSRPPAEQGDDELYDILIHVDRRAHPDRYQAARDEYVRRHGDRINGQPIDTYLARARLERPSAAKSRLERRVLVAVAFWSLFMLVLRAVHYLASHWHGRTP